MSAADVRRTRLEELRRNYQNLQAQLQNLTTAIRANEEEISTLAPVYTLPEDVVVLILKTAYQHHFPHCRLDDGMSHTHTPIAISHASRWWRRHALSVPHIWTCIHVTHDQPPSYDAIIKAYLARSRNLPISIFYLSYLTYPRPHNNRWKSQTDDWPRYKSCWEHLLAEAHRWKNCAVYLRQEDTVEMVLGDLENKTLPELEFFGLSIHDDMGLDSSEIWCLPQFMAPKLTHLQSHSLLDITQSPKHLFSHLTELKISEINAYAYEFMDLLREAANTLQSLTLISILFNDPIISTTELTFTLPRLTRLTLANIVEMPRGHPNLYLAGICRAAPALLDLSIDCALDYLINLGLTFPTVSRLNHEMPLQADMSRASILAFPSLQTIQTTTERFVVTALQLAASIDFTSEVGCIAWPELKTLVVPPLDEAATELIKFVKHRGRVGRPLQTICVTGAEVDGEMLEALERLNVPKVITGFDSSDWDGLRTGWDYVADKPAFFHWGDSTSFEDQF